MKRKHEREPLGAAWYRDIWEAKIWREKIL